MKNNWSMAPTPRFLARFALIFALLIAPWPGWNDGYGHYFRAYGRLIFNSDEGSRVIVFAPASSTDATLDTEITLGNRALLDSEGKGLVRRTDINTRSVGWLPTALTIALVLSTPIAWGRRFGALVAALILIHAFIAFSLQAWIWDNSPDVALMKLSDDGKWLAAQLNYALLNQLGISFTVPVLIWVLVTFKRHDAHNHS